MIGNTAPRRWRLAVDVLAVLTAIALVLSGWAIASRFSETNRARAANKAVWHAVLCDIERATDARKDISKRRKIQSIKYYDHLLVDLVHTRGCGLVR